MAMANGLSYQSKVLYSTPTCIDDSRDRPPLDQQLFIYLASILPLGILAQWLAWRFRFPSILLLLAFGFLLGTIFDIDKLLAQALVAGGAESSSGVQLQPERLLFPFVSLAVAVIMFEGGMTLKLRELREAGRSVLQLCTLGALATWVLASVAAVFALNFSWRTSLLLGAILIVTGPTVIAPLLRHVRPVKRVGNVLKWEGIVIDPVGAVLAVLVFTALAASGTPSEALGQIAWVLLKTSLVGGVLGLATGILLVQMLSRYLIPDFLQNVFFLAVLLGVFALSNVLQKESGLVTVTVLGLYLGNQKFVPVRHVMEFKENLQVLLISTLFIVMASRIRLADLQAVGWRGLVFLALLIVVVRPLSVYASLLGTRLSWRERTFLAFVAPRGIVAAAVTSIFALEISIEAAHAQNAALAAMLGDVDRLVPAMFTVIVGTVAIYGLGAAPLARWLRIAAPPPQGLMFVGAPFWAIPIAKALQAENVQVLMIDTNYDNEARARMAGIPSVCASALSEFVQEDVDLSGIGRMLAVTSNDEVNSLSAQELSHLFGRKEVYQLVPSGSGEGRRSTIGEHLHGRLAFGRDLTFACLTRCVRDGFTVKRTALTAEFTMKSYRERYTEDAIILFIVRDGQLRIVTSQTDLKPTAGDKLIALIPPDTAVSGDSSVLS